MAGVAILIACAVAYFSYVIWKMRITKQRVVVTTTLPASDLRDLFARKVATSGWKVIDDANPMIAQSHIIGGIRQQIGMTISEQGATRVATVQVLRFSRKLTGVPTKALTLAVRRNGFASEVRRRDSAATIAKV